VPAATERDGVNRLLDALLREDRHRTLKRCEAVDLVLADTLCEAKEPLRHVSALRFYLTGHEVGGHKPLELGRCWARL